MVTNTLVVQLTGVTLYQNIVYEDASGWNDSPVANT